MPINVTTKKKPAAIAPPAEPILHEMPTRATIPARPAVERWPADVSHETPAEDSRETYGPYDPDDLPVCPVCEIGGEPYNQLRFEEGDAVCCSCWKRYPVKGEA